MYQDDFDWHDFSALVKWGMQREWCVAKLQAYGGACLPLLSGQCAENYPHDMTNVFPALSTMLGKSASILGKTVTP